MSLREPVNLSENLTIPVVLTAEVVGLEMGRLGVGMGNSFYDIGQLYSILKTKTTSDFVLIRFNWISKRITSCIRNHPSWNKKDYNDFEGMIKINE